MAQPGGNYRGKKEGEKDEGNDEETTETYTKETIFEQGITTPSTDPSRFADEFEEEGILMRFCQIQKGKWQLNRHSLCRDL